MFCPECKAEYINGITECADCHISLVWNLPQEEPDEFVEGEPVEWQPLVSTTNQGDLALIKSIFDGEGILYWVQGENRGLVPHGITFGALIHVDKDRFQEAKDLIQNLDLNNFNYSIRSTDELD